MFLKSWVNFIHKKTPLNHSAVLIWNRDLASTRFTEYGEPVKRKHPFPNCISNKEVTKYKCIQYIATWISADFGSMRKPPKSSQIRFASYLPYNLLDGDKQNYTHQELAVKFPCSRKHPRFPALSQPKGQNEGADVEVVE